MKTLPSSSSKIIVDKFIASSKEPLLSKRESCSLPRSRKLVSFGFLHSISIQHKAVHPAISSLSSKPLVDLETAETLTQETYQSKTVHVKFQLQKHCTFGEQFLIVGDDPMFGFWDPSSAIPLNWSKDDLWTVELDIPVGKSIQFKFLLKGRTGNILWQPGPDRIFQTWETNNTIAVSEDWDDSKLQKIVEEEQLADQNGQPAVNSEVMIVAENSCHSNYANQGSAIGDRNTSFAEKSIAEPHKEQLIADNTTPSQEKPKAIVADNLSYSSEDPKGNASSQKFGEIIISDLKEESMAIPNQNVMIALENLGNNDRAPTIKNPRITNIEGTLINHEGPVLVPGLTPLSTEPTEEPSTDGGEKIIAADTSVETYEAIQDQSSDESEKRIVFDASVEAYEAKGHTVTEFDEKQELDGEPPQQASTKLFNGEEQLNIKCNQKIHSPKREEQPDSEPTSNIVLQNDIQWGRKTLRKLLANLGLL